MADVCRGVGNFWLFLMFAPISFKLVFLKRGNMGCILLNVSVDGTVDAQYVAAFLLFPLYLGELRCMLPKIGLSLYV